MPMEYKARSAEAGSGGGSSTKGKKVTKTKAGVATKKKMKEFSGVVTLNSAAFGQVYACMTNPGKPTPSLLRGQAFLQRRYKKA